MAQLGMWLKMDRFGGSIGDVVAHRLCGGGSKWIEVVAQLVILWLS